MTSRSGLRLAEEEIDQVLGASRYDLSDVRRIETALLEKVADWLVGRAVVIRAAGHERDAAVIQTKAIELRFAAQEKD